MGAFKKPLVVGGRRYTIYSLREAQKGGMENIPRLPRSLKVLLENLLRHENGTTVTREHIEAFDGWPKQGNRTEIAFHPARVVMQDFTGVPAVVDLAAMREAMLSLGGEADKINPLIPVDLVIDHSLQVEHFADPDAFQKNVEVEYRRNRERYRFLKWGQRAFKNFRVVPPGTGIIHQVNLESLAQVVWSGDGEGEELAYPDTCVGTDSHTTMINGLGVLGWGVGGIEAEAAMLGRPVTMLIPEVVGLKLTGRLGEGTSATDLVLNVVQRLREHGVVGKFVEFFGPGLAALSLADRATLANMAPEYGATCGFFPVDEKTLEYLRFTGRDRQRVELVESYAKEQGLWWDLKEADPQFSAVVELDMNTVEPCLAGPSRPQDKIPLPQAADSFAKAARRTFSLSEDFAKKTWPVKGRPFHLNHGAVVVAAITSCTNTSNPAVLVAAGLVAKRACQRGMKVHPWVKTSLAPGSKVVTDYLVESGLQQYLDELGFHLVGYGCTTCIGNTGPLPAPISEAINEHGILAAAVLSGNRNFEGRISADVKANYLASPPLVVIYALAGNMGIDVTREPIGVDGQGKEVTIKDLWPSGQEIDDIIERHISGDMYKKRYADVFEGDRLWQAVDAPSGDMFRWDEDSTYVRSPSFFAQADSSEQTSFELSKARILLLLGDSVTTDHISPAGAIAPDGPAARYLREHNIAPGDWNSFGSRRGNHEVMVRGTFANIRIRNKILAGVEGGYTRHFPSGEQLSVYEAAQRYCQEKTPLVVFAGREYGTGSSRDWAAKGTRLLGIKAVVAESFERIHRSNLIGMGVLPLQWREPLPLRGAELISLSPVGEIRPAMELKLTVTGEDGASESVSVTSRLDTLDELNYFLAGGILQYVLHQLARGR